MYLFVKYFKIYQLTRVTCIHLCRDLCASSTRCHGHHGPCTCPLCLPRLPRGDTSPRPLLPPPGNDPDRGGAPLETEEAGKTVEGRCSAEPTCAFRYLQKFVEFTSQWFSKLFIVERHEIVRNL